MPEEEEAEAGRSVTVAFVGSCCGIGRFDGLADRALREDGVMVPWRSSAEGLDVPGCVVTLADLITVSLFSEEMSSEVTGDMKEAVVVSDEKEDTLCIPFSPNELGLLALLPQETV